MKAELMTQTQLLDLFDINHRTFANLTCTPVMQQGTAKYYRFKDVMEAYVNYRLSKRLVMASNDEVLDKEHEEALKIREDRIAKQLKNAKTLGEQAPIEVLEHALQSVCSSMNAILTSLPLNIKRQYPELPAAVIRLVESELIKAQNLMADIEVDWNQES